MGAKTKDVARDWWASTALRANRWYALGIVIATLAAFAAPYVLGRFVPCAEFMEVEWLMLAVLCTTGVGVLNVFFSFASILERLVPRWSVPPMRMFVLVVVPILLVTGATWIAFSPFWYALLNDPELLCD